ncbi:MAG: hypothetical protein OM95_14035 [Bdellovibrio sp. ArHS]|uniref:alpha/beta hydrolase n=1 Tax=Bdellovibrio sp. ArHS TaxID=1569284 RepID=UPI0005837EA8|nr:alpha/beta hydrolase [Bdellovibrio sp. ArHS]KHD87555.1 MAG: hypothetical protein OM95_14035 [Bdellovibrio sp. ArHS]
MTRSIVCTIFTLFIVGFAVTAEAKKTTANFDLVPFKTLTLASDPNITVPVYKSPGKHGPAILLVHGNSSSSRSYVKQILGSVGLHRKIFALDLPGYGQSGKVDASLPLPVNAQGAPIGFAQYQSGLVEAIGLVANDSEVNAKVVVGWSLGGDLTLLTQGLGLLPNIKGIMMFGTAPAGAQSPAGVHPFKEPNIPGVPFTLGILPSFGFAFQLNPASPYGFDLNASFTDPVPAYAPAPINQAPNIGVAYIRAFFNEGTRLSGQIPGIFYEDGMIRTDQRARASLGASVLGFTPPGPVPFPDELQVLQNLAGSPTTNADDIKIAVLHGEEDAFVNLNYLEALKTNGLLPTLWKNKIHVIKDAGHAAHYEKAPKFNKMLEKFVQDL